MQIQREEPLRNATTEDRSAAKSRSAETCEYRTEPLINAATGKEPLRNAATGKELLRYADDRTGAAEICKRQTDRQTELQMNT